MHAIIGLDECFVMLRYGICNCLRSRSED